MAIYGSHPYHHNNGSFYIRVRPDFELADLLSQRQYVYDFYGFSMAPAVIGNNLSIGFDTLPLGKWVLGISNSSVFQEYRYLIMKSSANYNITLKRVPGQGDPEFYLHTSNTEDLSVGARARKFYKSVDVAGTDGTSQTLVYTQAMRQANPRCGAISHSAQQDGSQACFIVIAVTCKVKVRKNCAYRIKIEQEGFDSKKNYTATAASDNGFSPPPPQSIITQDYTNGAIGVNNQINYFFMPVNYTEKKEVMILVNKTKMSNYASNANTKIMINIQRDIDKYPDYTQWKYPSFGKVPDNAQISDTGSSKYPEIIEVCEETLRTGCVNARGCAILAGVVGKDIDANNPIAEYRIRGFYGDNKIYNNKPINVTKDAKEYKDGKDVWDYYWFVINDVAIKAGSSFDYHISVASTTGGDPDLFVSLLDGRQPSADDYDLVSQKKGADFLEITSNSDIWKQRGWETKYGVVVVAGVRTRKA